MKKIIFGFIFLIITTISLSTGSDAELQPPADPVNEIVDDREIIQEKDLEEIRLPEIKNEDIAKKFTELETNGVIYKEKIENLEKDLNDKNRIIADLENKVEKLMIITNSLEEKSKTTDIKIVEDIKGNIYKTGIIIISILAGATIILIALVVLQTNKNKKMVEEWKEFFEMNLDRMKNSGKNSDEFFDFTNNNDFINKMKKQEKFDELDDDIL